MRKQLLAVVLTLLPLGSAAEAQTPRSTGQAALQKVDVIREGDSVPVEIAGHGPWTPKVGTLDSPPRVVVAFSDTEMSTSQHHIDVEGRSVKAVRVGTDRGTPPTTRVDRKRGVDCNM